MSCPLVSSPLCAVIHSCLSEARAPPAFPRLSMHLTRRAHRLFSCKSSSQHPQLDEGEGNRGEAGPDNYASAFIFLACYSALALWGHSFPLIIASHSLSSLSVSSHSHLFKFRVSTSFLGPSMPSPEEGKHTESHLVSYKISWPSAGVEWSLRWVPQGMSQVSSFIELSVLLPPLISAHELLSCPWPMRLHNVAPHPCCGRERPQGDAGVCDRGQSSKAAKVAIALPGVAASGED